LGALFNEIGNRTPIVRTYLGGGAIVAIFASAALVTFNLIPESVISNVNSFMNDFGFLNFYIAALITGSILGMGRKLLIKASVRFLPVAVASITVALLLVGTAGALIGYGFKEAIMFIAIPMMGGGMGAGVIPLSNMY
ncbi:citrate:sodium symporter, partial [Clostridium perfringens]